MIVGLPSQMASDAKNVSISWHHRNGIPLCDIFYVKVAIRIINLFTYLYLFSAVKQVSVNAAI